MEGGIALDYRYAFEKSFVKSGQNQKKELLGNVWSYCRKNVCGIQFEENSLKNQTIAKLLTDARHFLKSGDFASAKAVSTQILEKFPMHIEVLDIAIRADAGAGKLSDAWLTLVGRVTKIGDKAGISMLPELLVTMHECGQAELMERCSRWYVSFRPSEPLAWDCLSISLIEQAKYEEAVNASRVAVRLLPGSSRFHANLGAGLNGLREFSEALKHLETAVAIDPGLANAYNNLGNALNGLGEHDRALQCYKRAISINPSVYYFYFNAADMLHQIRQYTSAEEYYRKSMELHPGNYKAIGGLIDVLNLSGRAQEAMTFAESYLPVNPVDSKFWGAYGNILQRTGLIDKAIDAYMKALEFEADPRSDFSRKIYSSLLFVLNNHPDLPAEVIFGAYQEYEQKFAAPFYSEWQKSACIPVADKKLRVGFLSQAFFNHVCRYFMLPLFEHIDRNIFEIFVYDDSPTVDHVSEKYARCADHWQRITGWSDQEVADRIRQDAVDILIDVSGHSTDNRLGIFARKPAPVSLHWLDFGYTTGLRAIDYYLTDMPGAPEGSDHLFAEKVWRLDVPAFVYRPDNLMPEPSESPFLKDGIVTFGCLSRANRINHHVVRVWSAILNAMPDSRLLISSGDFGDPGMREQMISRFVAEGVARERLNIGYSSPSHVPLQSVDIGLDCFPHNSGTTLIESLYMGIPFITLAGRPSVGRIGSSVLHAAGFPEWIAETEMEYAQKVLMLAHDHQGLIDYRKKLRHVMQQSPLMDEAGFARGFERALRQMWQRYCEQENI
ncbi:tetratricopeptide repeat protein [Undibacterium luofuense]|uniref:tetratricopeptide repeat protein n=1 Tax=Undibacterium luofuense TaxID=2828733 RepID=UPI001BAF14C1|nr:tetratricopeptide repeat protein [Undibacterium luofuense]